jgi:beta-lactam-binding protein with PASTA domain
MAVDVPATAAGRVMAAVTGTAEEVAIMEEVATTVAVPAIAHRPRARGPEAVTVPVVDGMAIQAAEATAETAGLDAADTAARAAAIAE